MSPLRVPKEEDMQWKIVHLRADETARSQGSTEQKSPFDGKGKSTASLDLNFRIQPKGAWEQLTKYGRCVATEEMYRNKDYVFVLPPEGLSGAQSKVDVDVPGVRDFWVARILEIRAKDDVHVYARVYWMYWPDDLPKLTDCAVSATGRRSYHGKYELIASNHMEILNVSTFAGLASVSLWQENDDEDFQTDLYWRQTYDYRTGNSPYELKKYCICESYYNPNKIIVSCSNLDCGIWIHAECLVDFVLTKKCQSLNTSIETVQGTTVKSRKLKTTKDKMSQIRKPYEGVFSAEIVGGEEDDPPQAEITDLRLDNEHKMRKWKEVTVCPKCATKIE